jgi:hypothetical protein
MKAADILTHVGEFCVKCAKAHQAAMDGEEEDTTQHNFHKTMMAECTGMAEKCLSALKTLKAAGVADDDELQPLPEGLSRVTPGAEIRSVPRIGTRLAVANSEENQLYQKIWGSDEE